MTADETAQCGATTADGGTCELRAGWGTGRDEGPCRHHDDRRSQQTDADCFDCDRPAGRFGWCGECCPLTDQRKAFVDEYLRHNFNATQAAKAAGYSEATARQQGSRLLSSVNVRRALRHRCRDRGMQADTALAQYTAIAFGIADHPGDGYRDYDRQRALEKILEATGALDEDTVQLDWGHALEQFDAIFGLDISGD